MTKVITFGIQKGGCSKSTTCGITAYLLAKAGYRVLVVDMDSQGNVSELLTGRETSYFRNRTVLDAMKAGDASDYLVGVSDRLHVCPSDAMMATFSRWIYRELEPAGKDPNFALRDALEPIVFDYDYVLIDTPPALGDATLNALAISDHVVILFEPSRFCYSALPEFFEVVEMVRSKVNPELNVAGILRNLTDPRRSDVKAYNEVVADEHPELVFDTVITRKAATGRVAIDGLNDKNAELKAALEPYTPFVKELQSRCPISKTN